MKLAETANAGNVIGGTEGGMRLPEGNQRLSYTPFVLFAFLLPEIVIIQWPSFSSWRVDLLPMARRKSLQRFLAKREQR